jgi:YD repeat-containing protein
MESDHARAGQGGRGGWCAPHERRHLVPWPQEAERIGVPPADHSYATTTYAWNANDTLATTTDGDGNVRHFTYDGRGLRLTAEDLHDTGDGTFGNWTYSYDNGGNLSSFVDPKSQTVNFTYDGLNRVLTENYTGQAGTEIEYGYDACTNGKTRLCSATSTDAVSTTTYNALGLPATTTMAIDNAYYTTAYRYDREGNMSNIVYPDNSEVQYTFNTAGLPDKVQQKESGGSFADIVSNFEYGPHGQVTYKLFGNNVENTYTFDATKCIDCETSSPSPLLQEKAWASLGEESCWDRIRSVIHSRSHSSMQPICRRAFEICSMMFMVESMLFPTCLVSAIRRLPRYPKRRGLSCRSTLLKLHPSHPQSTLRS